MSINMVPLTRFSLNRIFGRTNKFISTRSPLFDAKSEKSKSSSKKTQETTPDAKSEKPKVDTKKTQGTSPQPEVAGLSSKVLNVPNKEVGSGASKSGNYKNPEYFCYNPSSYFEAEIEMLKYRLPQPTAGKK